MDLMGFRGTPPQGWAGIGAYIAFGGILMLLGSIGEWILGNTFPCVVFGSFGAFWITLGITLMPTSGAISSYDAANKTSPAAFYNSYGASIPFHSHLFRDRSLTLNLCRFLLGLHGCSGCGLLDLRSPHQLDPFLDPLLAYSSFRLLDSWLFPPRSRQDGLGYLLHHRCRCLNIRHMHAGLVDLRRHPPRVGRLPALSSR